jgi:hypothetical protein
MRSDGILYSLISTTTIQADKWVNGVWVSTGSSVTPGSNPVKVAVSPDGTRLACTQQTSPYISVWNLNSDGTFGSKWSDPASLPTATPSVGGDCVWSNDSKALIIGESASPYIEAYNCTAGNAFGAKYSNPGTLPTGANSGIVYNPVANFVAGNFGTTEVAAYAFSSSTGFGAKTTASGGGASQRFCPNFTPDGLKLVTIDSGSSYPNLWPFNTSTGAFSTVQVFTAGGAGVNGLYIMPDMTAFFTSSASWLTGSPYARTKTGLTGSKFMDTNQIASYTVVPASFQNVVITSGQSIWMRQSNAWNMVYGPVGFDGLEYS